MMIFFYFSFQDELQKQTQELKKLSSVVSLMFKQQRDFSHDMRSPEKVIANRKSQDLQESQKLQFGINHGSFHPEIPLIHYYDILIEPEKCLPDNNILLGIKSEAENRSRINSVRKTWGDKQHYKV